MAILSSKVSSYTAQSAVLLVTVFVGLMLLVSPPHAAIVAILSPLIALAHNAKRLKDLVDYRVIYLVALSYWGLPQAIGLLLALDEGDASLRAVSATVYANYAIGLSLSPLLIYLFRAISISSSPLATRSPITFSGSIAILGMAYLTTLTILTILRANPNIGFISIAIPSITCCLVFFQGAIIAEQYGKPGSHAWIVMLLLITSLVTSLGVANRTSLLMPLLSGLLCLLVLSRSKNRRFLSLRTGVLFAALIAIMIIADIQKQMKINYALLIPELISNPDILLYSMFNTNYSATSQGSVLYFDLLQKTVGEDRFSPGHYALQLLTSVAPRALWDVKPQYDISTAYYSEGIIDRPLYFDFLFDRLIDSGGVGVLLYNTLYIFIMRFCFSLGNLLALNRMKSIGVSLYALSLVVIFMTIRGPIILISWFLIPAILMAIIFLFAKLAIDGRIIFWRDVGLQNEAVFTGSKASSLAELGRTSAHLK